MQDTGRDLVKRSGVHQIGTNCSEIEHRWIILLRIFNDQYLHSPTMKIERYTKIVIESQPDYYLVKCGKCDGGGIQPTKNRTSCSACDGVGKQKVEIPTSWDCDVGLAKCNFCGASGIQPTKNRTTCNVCEGVGALVKCFPRVSCGKCDGGGIKPTKNRTPCDVCKGAGSVWIDNVS